jgi:hypothetical protein
MGTRVTVCGSDWYSVCMPTCQGVRVMCIESQSAVVFMDPGSQIVQF